MALFFVAMCLSITQLHAQEATQEINQQLDQLLENNKISQQDSSWKITSATVSSISGVQHVYYRQVLNGLEVHGTESGIHLLPNGEVLSEDNKFIANAGERALGGNQPSITAIQAVQAAAQQFGYNITEGISVLERSQGLDQESLLSNGGISKSPIPAKLIYTLNDDNELVLVWDLSIEENAGMNWWNARVDAISGQIVNKTNWMVSCSFEHDHSTHEEMTDYNRNLVDMPNYNAAALEVDAGCTECYEVIALPFESPFFSARTIETNSADPVASPFGWHDTNGAAGAEFTTTRGNNVNSYEDGDNPGYQPDAGSDLDFIGYPFSEFYSNANQFEDAAITNLFYWNNVIHDLLFFYGLDEAGGNFQETNYSGVGNGSDSVNAEAQDGSGTCNANFGTPPDGANPRMQMFVCGDRDGDYDNLVIVHEYGHGVSNRLTGGPNNTGCLGNTEQMGEGWSDYLGAIMTMLPGANAEDPRPVGTFLFGQGPNGGGIRPFPYSTDFAVNPQTYDDIKTAAVPHGVGSVWASTLWEVTWELIGEHGWDADIYNFTGDVNQDAGNVQALALVMEGMKLQPCSPGFVDGRDAIFAADQAIYGERMSSLGCIRKKRFRSKCRSRFFKQ